jgi:hypothetical protein
MIIQKAYEAYQALSPAKLAKASASQLGMIFGIMFDKYQLLTGGATSRVNVTLANIVELVNKQERDKLQTQAIDAQTQDADRGGVPGGAPEDGASDSSIPHSQTPQSPKSPSTKISPSHKKTCDVHQNSEVDKKASDDS